MDDMQCICSHLKSHPDISWQAYADSVGVSFSSLLSSLHDFILREPDDVLFSPEQASQTVLTIGGGTVDLITRLHQPMTIGELQPASFTKVFGGVARNVAENICRLGVQAELMAPIGDDDNGQLILSDLQRFGMSSRFMLTCGHLPTAAYMALLNDDGSLYTFAIYDGLWTWFEQILLEHLDALCLFWQHYPIWLCDLHFNRFVTRRLIDQARLYNRDFYIVGVSERVMSNLPEDLSGLKGLILNSLELAALLEMDVESDQALEKAALLVQQRGVETVFVTCGAKGVLSLDAQQNLLWHDPAEQIDPVDVTGAGDAFTAGFLAAYSRGISLEKAVRVGMTMAECVIQHMGATCSDLTPALLDRCIA